MSQIVGYLGAAAVVVLGVLVVARLVRSWRAAYDRYPSSHDDQTRS